MTYSIGNIYITMLYSLRIHYKLMMLNHSIMSATVAIVLLSLAWWVLSVAVYSIMFNRPPILYQQQIRNNVIRQNPVAEYV